MHRSTAGHNPYNLLILTKDYSKNLTTSYLLSIRHTSMFVVKSIVIHINGQGYGYIDYLVYTRIPFSSCCWCVHIGKRSFTFGQVTTDWSIIFMAAELLWVSTCIVTSQAWSDCLIVVIITGTQLIHITPFLQVAIVVIEQVVCCLSDSEINSVSDILLRSIHKTNLA